MNGAVIPAILWYLVTFSSAVPAAPITLMGPLSHERCVEFEKTANDPFTWCQALRIKQSERK